YIKGELVGGCDIMMSMHSTGELEEMLLEKGILEPEQDAIPAEKFDHMISSSSSGDKK
ncbi:MAG: hypothetical protein SGCHY_005548, partial [Lobulomycetales sp.]